MVVREIEADVGAVVQAFDVVLELDAELVLPVGLAVVTPIDRRGEVRDRGERAVDQRSDAVRIVCELAESDRQIVRAAVVEVGVEGRVKAAVGRRRDRLPLEQVEGRNRRTLEGWSTG